MHCLFLLFIQCLILQNALSKDITTSIKSDDELRQGLQRYTLYKELMLFEDQQRGISEIWNHIKDSAKVAWNSLKTLVDKTKERIDLWIQQVKNRADIIKQKLKEKLTTLRIKIKNVVNNILANETVQICIKKSTEDFDSIIIEIINKVSLCITDKITTLSTLDYGELKVMKNDTKCMDEIEKNLTQCIENKQNADRCLLNARMKIITETEAVADEVLNRKLESRGLADDILDAITTCSTDGLTEATTAVSTEAINIIQCLVKQGQPEANVTTIEDTLKMLRIKL